MPQINRTVSLAPGAPTKLTNNGQVNASGQSIWFTVPRRPSGGEFTLALQIVGNPSGLTSTLQSDTSSGGAGTNFVTYATGPSGAGVFIIRASSTNPIVGGSLYALSVTALTGGAFDVWAVVN